MPKPSQPGASPNRREELDPGCAQQARREFMTGISHRIRLPLNGLVGMVELLGNSALPDGMDSLVESAVASGEELTRLVDDLLDLCWEEPNELVLMNEAFSPAQAVNDVIAEFAHQAQEKQLLLTTSCSSEVPDTINGDPRRLRRVLFELILNALRLTTDGQVQVGVRSEGSGEYPQELLFWVKDTGAGMDSRQVNGLFQLGLGRTASDEISIGLPLAKRIIHAMGGAIEVESELAQGTTVLFTLPTRAELPAAQDAHDPESEGGPPGQEDRRAACVLIVEDDLVNQRVTFGFLKRAGHEGVVVDSGASALKALAEDDYDLVLMDKMMPGMSGPEATRAIRSGEGGVRCPSIPIIALTAEVSVASRRECLDAGMNDYLTKPMRRGEIETVMRAWLPPHLRAKLQKVA